MSSHSSNDSQEWAHHNHVDKNLIETPFIPTQLVLIIQQMGWYTGK